ncbi:hypothetical protein GGX14DRAFT_26826 [Mycena pura]|uniref:Uncharacterized protein n=1 Tax=Mycena pura TaxID=153505 RepID=A0AAD6UXI6_9AGAR|nr:hypothetical protein GGX14DRAFT_26826 [Mycena pura]
MLLTARAINAAGECAPYVAGVFGMAVVLLEAVEKVKNNRDGLKNLCKQTVQTMNIIQDQMASNADVAAPKLTTLCAELESFLQSALTAVHKLQSPPQGFRAHLKELLRSSRTAGAIAEYQNDIQGLCSRLQLLTAIDTNFQTHRIQGTLTTMISPGIAVSLL